MVWVQLRVNENSRYSALDTVMYVENNPTSRYSTLKRSALGKVTRKTIPHLGTVKLKTSALGTETSKTSAQ